MEKYLLAILIAVVGYFGFTFHPSAPSFGAIGLNQPACTTSTVAVATVGNQSSVTLLAANSRRAWAQIEQPINATNTVSVALNAGTAATLTSGLQLTSATTSNPVPSLSFGLATANPYVGAVTGITNTGSSTVLVTQCNY